VLDCSAAGLIINSLKALMDARAGGAAGYGGDAGSSGGGAGGPGAPVDPMREVIVLAACGANELLPQNPDLPADVFTAALTTPIKVALRWFCSRSLLRHDGLTKELIDRRAGGWGGGWKGEGRSRRLLGPEHDAPARTCGLLPDPSHAPWYAAGLHPLRIPGRQTDRKTPLGELNWIFTAITDTIAWNSLPRATFQKLFRQDLLVASLFRNFLLAERVLAAANATPVSWPRLPPTHQHPMWQAWDMAAEMCLLQVGGGTRRGVAAHPAAWRWI
jgi:regulator-associated protein of mTOR